MSKFEVDIQMDTGISTEASIDELTLDVPTIGNPPLSDYFQWRQDKFNPRNHWPLTDKKNSTEVINLGSGPDGTMHGDFLGGKSIVRSVPNGTGADKPYTATGRIEMPVGTADFVHKTGIFTIGWWWYLFEEGYAIPISCTDRFGGGDAGFMISSRFDNIPKMLVPTNDGSLYQTSENTFWRQLPDLDGIQEVEHQMWVGDGDKIRLFRNAMLVQAWDWPDNAETDLDPSYPLCLFTAGSATEYRGMHGRMQGVIVDDRPWSTEEIKADYERGLGTKWTTQFRPDDAYVGTDEFDYLVDFDQLIQWDYLKYDGSQSVYRGVTSEGQPWSPVLNSGDPIAYTGCLQSSCEATQDDSSIRPTWDDELGVVFDGNTHLDIPADQHSLGRYTAADPVGGTLFIKYRASDIGTDVNRVLGSIDGTTVFQLNTNQPDEGGARFALRGSGGLTRLSASSVFNDGDPHVIALRNDPQTDILSMFVDGVVTDTESTSGSSEVLNVGLAIGARNLDGSIRDNFTGSVSLIADRHEPLSDAEIATISGQMLDE